MQELGTSDIPVCLNSSCIPPLDSRELIIKTRRLTTSQDAQDRAGSHYSRRHNPHFFFLFTLFLLLFLLHPSVRLFSFSFRTTKRNRQVQDRPLYHLCPRWCIRDISIHRPNSPTARLSKRTVSYQLIDLPLHDHRAD